MTNNISQSVLHKVSKYIENRFGLYFTEKRFNDLIRVIYNSSKQKNIDLEKYINLMLSNKLSQEDIKNLIAHLTIGETYFFRDTRLFENLRNEILPNIINKRKYSSKNLKIWSAGCSSGEEAYSIAILIRELIPNYKDWNIKIIATDINHISINKAKKGIYSEWSFRGVDLDIINKYFDKVDNRHYKLKNDIIEFVSFHNLNLADSTYLVDSQIISNVDIIFCRNVLMYFSADKINEIINRFYNSISDEGCLIVAPTESLFLKDSLFKSVNINDVFIYNKSSHNNDLLNNLKKNLERSILINTDINEYKSYVENIKTTTNITKTSIIEEIEIEKIVQDEEFESAENYEKKARSCANEGNFEEAIKCCERAISIDKINPFYYYLLASIYQEQENVDEAIISLKKSIYLDVNFIMAYFDLGNLNLKKEKYKEAFKCFENARELLENFNDEDIIPHSEEMTVGALKKIIENIDCRGAIYEYR